jgi:hypothetical protein
MYHAFGLIGTALSKKIGVFQSSSLKVVSLSPNASYGEHLELEEHNTAVQNDRAWPPRTPQELSRGRGLLDARIAVPEVITPGQPEGTAVGNHQIPCRFYEKWVGII